ncbi:NADP-dependent oxidoreductase [Actinacidiphila bryophytorum]|uniref:NADP-dependent oxidoreductase n=1 Tax=Actinacidiphila bryophytorum TaxID=1436133 RepID=UPI002176CF44|nr:NADP-dependent oxidoreductase [Actinacidiphila bryophytorum]UWE11665.1 NADP-dependent oxidoreductase [Actinacidiphila bryophytorum]
MRAVVVRDFGGPEALVTVEAPLPEPGPGQLRIAVQAAAVNPIDLAVRAGCMITIGFAEPQPQFGVGWDVAGTVDAVGAGVEFLVGDAVIGLVDRLDLVTGGYAEYVVLDAAAVGRAPDGVPPAEAATLPLCGLTAVQALDLLDLAPGDTLLVTGAAGGVGGFAVELAAARGLRVVALASPEDEELVRGLGARYFVPRGERVADAVRGVVPGGVDGVLDAAGLKTRALEALRAGGAFVAVGLGADPVPRRGTRVHNVWVRADGPRLTELAALAEAGRLTLRVAATYPLAAAAAAHTRQASPHLRGRLVLLPTSR